MLLWILIALGCLVVNAIALIVCLVDARQHKTVAGGMLGLWDWFGKPHSSAPENPHHGIFQEHNKSDEYYANIGQALYRGEIDIAQKFYDILDADEEVVDIAHVVDEKDTPTDGEQDDAYQVVVDEMKEVKDSEKPTRFLYFDMEITTSNDLASFFIFCLIKFVHREAYSKGLYIHRGMIKLNYRMYELIVFILRGAVRFKHLNSATDPSWLRDATKRIHDAWKTDVLEDSGKTYSLCFPDEAKNVPREDFDTYRAILNELIQRDSLFDETEREFIVETMLDLVVADNKLTPLARTPADEQELFVSVLQSKLLSLVEMKRVVREKYDAVRAKYSPNEPPVSEVWRLCKDDFLHAQSDAEGGTRNTTIYRYFFLFYVFKTRFPLNATQQGRRNSFYSRNGLSSHWKRHDTTLFGLDLFIGSQPVYFSKYTHVLFGAVLYDDAKYAFIKLEPCGIRDAAQFVEHTKHYLESSPGNGPHIFKESYIPERVKHFLTAAEHQAFARFIYNFHSENYSCFQHIVKQSKQRPVDKRTNFTIDLNVQIPPATVVSKSVSGLYVPYMISTYILDESDWSKELMYQVYIRTEKQPVSRADFLADPSHEQGVRRLPEIAAVMESARQFQAVVEEELADKFGEQWRTGIQHRNGFEVILEL